MKLDLPGLDRKLGSNTPPAVCVLRPPLENPLNPLLGVGLLPGFEPPNPKAPADCPVGWLAGWVKRLKMLFCLLLFLLTPSASVSP